MTGSIPECDIDIFADDVLRDPYPAYAAMRKIGPLVRLTAHDLVAVPRYAEARAVLLDNQRFLSGRGVGFNEEFNTVRAKSIIASDPPRHTMLRQVLAERLGPRALNEVNGMIRDRAAALITELTGSGSFDAVTDMAEVFPVEVVGELIGLPAGTRGQLLQWANGAFNAFGPDSERTSAGLQAIQQQFAYITTVATRKNLSPGSMGAAVYAAADAGLIPEEYCLPLLSAYLTAGMDTTVNALGAMVNLLGEHPDQWHLLRSEPALVPAAVNEVLRIESPVQVFGRVAAQRVEVGGATVEAGERVAVMFGSANRDERQYPDPHRFDVRRNPAGHLAFGAGSHACAGQALARMELQAVLNALIAHVDSIAVGEPIRKINHVLRGLSSLPAAFTADNRVRSQH